jgi:hypothetical protein
MVLASSFAQVLYYIRWYLLINARHIDYFCSQFRLKPFTDRNFIFKKWNFSIT